MQHGRHVTSPLSYEALEYAGDFCTEHCPEGIVAISDTFLRILAVERRGDTFNQQVGSYFYCDPFLVTEDTEADWSSCESSELTRVVLGVPCWLAGCAFEVHTSSSGPVPRPSAASADC